MGAIRSRVQSVAISVSACLFVCLFVCLSARISLKPHVQISPNFLYMFQHTCGRGSVFLWL